MQDDVSGVPEPPFEGVPTWVRIVEAAIVGVIAGLALHALVSIVVLEGKDLWSPRGGASECRKSPATVSSHETGARS